MEKDQKNQTVLNALKYKGYTYDECCKAFNAAYEADINAKNLRKMDKSLISRIVNNEATCANMRVAKLYEFLSIETTKAKHKPLEPLSKEAKLVDDLIKKHPSTRSLVIHIVKGIEAAIQKEAA